MRAKRQNIQMELALEPEEKGEARSAGDQGTEARMARAEPERPATGQGPSMEEVVEPGNLKKARVRHNKGSPSHHMIGEIDDFIEFLERIASRPHVVAGSSTTPASRRCASRMASTRTRDRDFSLCPELVTRDPFE